MKHLSLFSGVGGFDLGLERAGIDLVGHVEWDKYCQQVLRSHWPDVPLWGDIKEVTGDQLPTGVDVLSGGFPCQDISVAGKRAGLDGDRSGLWFEFARLILEVAPRWVLIENVPGVLSSNGGRDMGTILGFLGDNGFRWAYRVLDSQWFGVAQRRRRVFIVASRGTRSPTEVLFEPESSGGNPPTRGEAGQGVAPTLAARTRGGGGLGTDFDLDGGLVRIIGEHDGAHVAGALAAQPGMKQQSYLANAPGVRRLTPVECERLQGFPDGWSSDIVSDTQAYRQMGNAVTVPVAEWIGHRLFEQL